MIQSTPSRRRHATAFAVLLVVLAGPFSDPGVAGIRGSTGIEPPPASRAVLVELFTSEGCSSCPPADRLLMELKEKQPVAGVEVVPLAFHVDYWNHLGWRDPFSSPNHSERQRRYAAAENSPRVYTPQMIVGGTESFVGSDRLRALEAIRGAPIPSASIRVEHLLADDGVLEVEVVAILGRPESGEEPEVDGARSDGRVAPAGVLDVLAAVTEDGLASDVAAGENAGRRLAHAAVVRSFGRIGRIEPGQARFTESARIGLDPEWDRRRLTLVVWIQRTGHRAVLGVTRSPLSR